MIQIAAGTERLFCARLRLIRIVLPDSGVGGQRNYTVELGQWAMLSASMSLTAILTPDIVFCLRFLFTPK
jgi:hypothetical protein